MKTSVPHRLARSAAAAALLLALGGCATLGEPVAPTYRESMAAARTHADAGQVREAVAALQQAALVLPASKEPWLEIARLRVAQNRHVDALAAAEQVLRRDPADPEASEISISSGLQVALQTMKRLRAADAASDEERVAEAKVIALLMAEVFGPEFLVTDEFRSRLAQEAVESYRASRVKKLPEAQTKPKGDPLDLLGGD